MDSISIYVCNQLLLLKNSINIKKKKKNMLFLKITNYLIYNTYRDI